MKKIPNNINSEIDETDQILLDFGSEVVSSIKPPKEVLKRVLDKIEVKAVTDNVSVRNTSLKVEDMGRSSAVNNLTKIINSMNNYIKILSGGAIVSALVVALIFMNQSDDKVSPIGLNNNTTQTKVEVAGEVVDVDSLLASLNDIDFAYDEPVFDDSDLTAGLINANNYEI
jgi:hypothetical protein